MGIFNNSLGNRQTATAYPPRSTFSKINFDPAVDSALIPICPTAFSNTEAQKTTAASAPMRRGSRSSATSDSRGSCARLCGIYGNEVLDLMVLEHFAGRRPAKEADDIQRFVALSLMTKRTKLF